MDKLKTLILFENLFAPLVVTTYFLYEKMRYTIEDMMVFKTIHVFIIFWLLILFFLVTKLIGFKKSSDEDFLIYLASNDVDKEKSRSGTIKKMRLFLGLILSLFSLIAVVSIFLPLIFGSPSKFGIFELAAFSILFFVSIKPVTFKFKSRCIQ